MFVYLGAPCFNLSCLQQSKLSSCDNIDVVAHDLAVLLCKTTNTTGFNGLFVDPLRPRTRPHNPTKVEIGDVMREAIAAAKNAGVLKLSDLSGASAVKAYCAAALLTIFTRQKQMFDAKNFAVDQNDQISKAKERATCAVGQELMEWAATGLYVPGTDTMRNGAFHSVCNARQR